MRNYLKIAGKDSRDFGVYISGQGTFSAPEKAYEFYGVPGRNGAILGNDHRLENIEVTYQCFIYNDFNKNIADFRTFLLSLNGYQRLEDSYHPDEYRMAVYAGPFEPEVTAMNNAGSFELVFNCKPQRYLVSGESTYRWIPGYAQVITGEIVNAYGPRIDRSTLSAVVSQYYTEERDWYNGSSFTDLGGFSDVKLFINGNQVYMFDDGQPLDSQNRSTTTTIEVNFITGAYTITHKIIDLTTLSWSVGDSSKGIFQTSSASPFNALRNCSVYTVRDVSAATSISNARTRLNQYDRGIAIYNGIILIKDTVLIGKTLSEFEEWITTLPAYDVNLGPVKADGQLVTPITGITPYAPYVLDSYNDFITVEAKPYYYYDPAYYFGIAHESESTVHYTATNDTMSNPTMFPSQPLLRVYGDGTLTMDGVAITITNSTTYTDIDCELMDCYEGNVNRNNDVTFSTYDFPRLQPGDNEVTGITGVTLIEITPRWWRV